MTPGFFTLLSAAHSVFLQPFQGFVSGAFCFDLQLDWYLHDFVIVSMVLHRSTCAFFVPICLQNCLFVPTCQVRVVRFYVSCFLLVLLVLLLLVLFLLLLLLSSPLFSSPRLLVSSPPAPCRTSTTTIHAQCALPDLNHDHPRPVFPAGPQPRVSGPSVPCRTWTTTIHAQCSLPDLNHDHPRPVFPAGPQPRVSGPSVPCRTWTTTIHAQCSLPDLNREDPCQVFPAGPHVGRYGTKNVQKKVRKNVRQICYILFANSRVCGRVPGAMPLLTLQVAKFEAISWNRWQSHWGGQRHLHFCTFGAVCKDAWDRQHLTASYYKLFVWLRWSTGLFGHV